MAISANMKYQPPKKCNRGLKKAQSAGFTLIETLVAGVVVASVMTAVGRLGVSAMATGRNQSSRTTIEASINDHIQLLQMQDSYLTKEAITSESGLNTPLKPACDVPSTFLKNHLENDDVESLLLVGFSKHHLPKLLPVLLYTSSLSFLVDFSYLCSQVLQAINDIVHVLNFFWK